MAKEAKVFIIQAYALFWIGLGLIALLSWETFAKLEPSSTNIIMGWVGRTWAPLVYPTLVFILVYDVFRLKKWGKYLYTMLVILSFSPTAEPYTFSDPLGNLWALFDLFYLYLLWVDEDTKDLFK